MLLLSCITVIVAVVDVVAGVAAAWVGIAVAVVGAAAVGNNEAAAGMGEAAGVGAAALGGGGAGGAELQAHELAHPRRKGEHAGPVQETAAACHMAVAVQGLEDAGVLQGGPA